MVFVLGDLFFDKYLIGSVNRVSPEAPIPVVNIASERRVPGGAANVAANLLGLGRAVRVCGVVGADECGSALAKSLKSAGADVSGIVTSQQYNTIEKVRVVGNRYQIVRLDYNEGQQITQEVIDVMVAALPNLLEGCSVAVISDYAKGTCTDVACKTLIQLCKKRGISIIVDPKGANWEKYGGAEWVTPNLHELCEATRVSLKNEDQDISNVAKHAPQRFGVGGLLITRSEKGMTMCQFGKTFHIPAHTRTVFDVSGAGDTVVAAFADALATGKGAVDAALYANTAAGIVVGKEGTCAITRAELETALRNEQMGDIQAKVMSWDAINSTIALWRENGNTVCVTNGCFDVFHKGHASLILAASKFCDKLIVAINSDASVKRLKGKDRPINAEQDRAYVLASLKYVDAVVIFDQDTPEELLAQIRPDVLVKSNEYNITQVPGRQFSGRVELVNYVDGYSTTSIIKKTKERN